MRKALSVVLLASVVLVAVESISSYILYRHYANLHRGFYPGGSATVELGCIVMAKFQGRQNEVDLSIDHGPLFRNDAQFGYAMYPGSYKITEKRASQIHRFSLTVDDFGRRITSYHSSSAAKRLFISGDSAMFGWGLDDEQTIPWLLQTRFPQFDVVNLSLTSYSTIQAMWQLERANPMVTADDIVVLTYHLITNGFNVASAEMLSYVKAGFEQQLGDPDLVSHMLVPFGAVDGRGELVVDRYEVACAKRYSTRPQCSHPPLTARGAMQVTQRAFDAIIAAHPAHFVVAFLSGSDSDPVIAHLKSKGVTIADLRTDSGDPDATDEVSIDEHAGPFWSHMIAERLAEALRRAHLVD